VTVVAGRVSQVALLGAIDTCEQIDDERTWSSPVWATWRE
jgi:hypothetical protein